MKPAYALDETVVIVEAVDEGNYGTGAVCKVVGVVETDSLRATHLFLVRPIAASGEVVGWLRGRWVNQNRLARVVAEHYAEDGSTWARRRAVRIRIDQREP